MKVTLGAVYGETVDSWYFQAIVDLLMKQPPPGFQWANASVGVRSGPLLAAGRGHLVGNFLEHTDGDVLMMIDTDQSFDPALFWDLAATFQKVKDDHPDLGILAGVTWMSGHPKLERPLPNLYHAGPQNTLLHATTYPENALVEVGAVGLSNLLLSRDCAAAVTRTETGRPINPFHHMSVVNWDALGIDLATWDDPVKIAEVTRKAVYEADQMGEDLSFCCRVREAGYRILVHTGIEFAHSKNYLLDGDDYRRAVKEWQEAVPVPALEAQ